MRALPLLVLVALAGCAGTTHTVRSSDAAGVNRQFADRRATVALTDGTLRDADALRIEADSTSWVDPGSGEMVVVATDAVAEVRRRDRGRAVRRSSLWGAAAGAVTGGVLFAAVGYDSGGCIVWCVGEPAPGARAEAAAVFGAVGAALGAVEGLAVGALVGVLGSPTDRYVLDRP